MFYFIPAWYNSSRPWYDITEPWYRGGGYPAFDDTINQLRMFSHAKQPSQLVILNYSPQLRYLSHNYDLLELPAWSLFDDIQKIELIESERIDFKKLPWPVDVEFIYTPFLILVRHKKENLATIEFGNDGQLIWINYDLGEGDSNRYIFDDRGFVSSIIYYKQGQEQYQEYLNPAGQWQIREYLLPGDRHVDVAPSEYHRFAQTSYANIDELIKERVESYFRTINREEARFILASHLQHNHLIQGVKGKTPLILSYYQKRFDLSQSEEVQKDLLLSDLVVADSLLLQEQLEAFNVCSVDHLSPFDTRLALGKSQRLKELIIYFLIDDLEEDVIRDSLKTIFEEMVKNEHIYLKVVTYNHDVSVRNAMNTFLEELLEEEDTPYLYFAAEEEETTMFEVLDEEQTPSRISFSYLGSELEIQRSLVFARLIIDLKEHPDLYTQIAGISAGIPQVNKKQSEFVEHLKNGYIVTEGKNLRAALEYYLIGLSNWNKSLVYSVQKIENYTSGRLVSHLIKKIENYE